MTLEWGPEQVLQVQRIALCGYKESNSALHLVLRVKDAGKTHAFVAELLQRNLPAFGHPDDGESKSGVNIGFTYAGLAALGLPDHHLEELRKKAPAFCEGAFARAARRLGDAGPSAVERWEPEFACDRAHVLISIHDQTQESVESIASDLSSLPGAREALEGWESRALRAEHLTKYPHPRTVHFGFRDNITHADIYYESRPPAGPPDEARTHGLHRGGELLLGYRNDESFNRWNDTLTKKRIVRFFRNGSFAALRKVQQDVGAFETFVNDRAAALKATYPDITREYLKAKLCGRWENGAIVRPGQWKAPGNPSPEDLDPRFDFLKDPTGTGCPFGAHIRRTNPRSDRITPFRLRPLFRRGMPYGKPYSEDTKKEQRGLVGLFFCASIDDQFETVMSEWVEKRPMGPPNQGNAKDPLIGHNDEAGPVFCIPQQSGADIELKGFAPFVTTRGTLYALFPSRLALRQIAGTRARMSRAAQAPDATSRARPVHACDAPACSSKPGDRYDPAPPDRFCDIVMEGGVTSGIIYASAVSELSKSYRFESIGGSSIGAFAAALTAAAEYNRRRGCLGGFKLMEGLPEKLAEEDSERKTLLLRLFRPQAETRRLFEIFLATLGDKSTASRILCGLAAAIRQYVWVVSLAALVAAVSVLAGPLALAWRDTIAPALSGSDLRWLELGSWAIALVFTVLFVVFLALLLAVAWDFGRGLVPNGLGLCRGWSKDAPYDPPDLSLFLHASIQEAAGLNPVDDPPLTFRDLWNAPGAASEILGCGGGADAWRSINLQVYSTNLAHGRPYRFPLDPADDMGRLFFRLEELEPYFPGPILDYLVASSRPYRPLGRFDPGLSSVPDGFLELPQDGLPIVVAARLAMSFPLLISAVKLYAIDYEATKDNRGLAPCWMSDGGLCSNFPIHLFDSFVPRWPTFGIALLERNPDRRNVPVWLPEKHYEGGADSWDRFADSKGLALLGGFLMSLWKAAWRWNDSTMMRMPGVRDRVVRVLLEPGEGGVNINMPSQAIRNLSRTYGTPAAEAFRRKFADIGSPGWPEHRWVRFNRLLIALCEQIEGFTCAADLDRYSQPLDDQISCSRVKAPLRGPSQSPRAPSEEPLSDVQINELRILLDALKTLEQQFRLAGDNKPYIAVPRPSLRVRHPT
jgi:deferrochelatase/peroxidase EfeB/predicted acylesterase/phospholipase RssA